MHRISRSRRCFSVLGAIALGMMIVPNVAEAQRQGGRRGGGPMMGSSVAYLLDKSSDLSLTEGQTEQLTAMKAQFDTDNAALMERMAQGRANRDRDAMQSAMQEYRASDLALIEQAMPLLDESQREKAKALLDERRANRRRPGGR